MKTEKSKFVKLVSDHFNGASGDTATLYEVEKLISKLHKEWLDELQQLINVMRAKDFYEDIIIEEIEKWIRKQKS